MSDETEELSRDTIALIVLHGLLSGGLHPVDMVAEKSFLIADQFLDDPDHSIGKPAPKWV